MPSLLVIGSGPGIGLATTTLFAEKKFNKVALLSRSSSRLQEDKAAILKSLEFKGKNDVEVNTWSIDIVNVKAFKNVLREVGKKHADLSCVVFNAARVETSDLLTFDEENMLKDFQACYLSPASSPLSHYFLSI